MTDKEPTSSWWWIWHERTKTMDVARFRKHAVWTKGRWDVMIRGRRRRWDDMAADGWELERQLDTKPTRAERA